MLTRNGTDGRVYGGDCNLVHIQDGQRAYVGQDAARYMAHRIRMLSTDADAFDKTVCPGCYMVALFNAAVELAKQNGQSLTELGTTMSAAFDRLAHGGPEVTEEIEVMLDPD